MLDIPSFFSLSLVRSSLRAAGVELASGLTSWFGNKKVKEKAYSNGQNNKERPMFGKDLPKSLERDQQVGNESPLFNLRLKLGPICGELEKGKKCGKNPPDRAPDEISDSPKGLHHLVARSFILLFIAFITEFGAHFQLASTGSVPYTPNRASYTLITAIHFSPSSVSTGPTSPEYFESVIAA